MKEAGKSGDNRACAGGSSEREEQKEKQVLNLLKGLAIGTGGGGEQRCSGGRKESGDGENKGEREWRT